mmetsp:Transcript_33691/g.82829  ORF Transcript_33691/g.82829 Transcript_33691/m.82829 type:complete len:179 (+) Transcript_33691:803-1339(+)
MFPGKVPFKSKFDCLMYLSQKEIDHGCRLDNYYTQVFSSSCTIQKLSIQHLDLAVRTVSDFDMCLLLEWLPESLPLFSHTLGLQGGLDPSPSNVLGKGPGWKEGKADFIVMQSRWVVVHSNDGKLNDTLSVRQLQTLTRLHEYDMQLRQVCGDLNKFLHERWSFVNPLKALPWQWSPQ